MELKTQRPASQKRQAEVVKITTSDVIEDNLSPAHTVNVIHKGKRAALHLEKKVADRLHAMIDCIMLGSLSRPTCQY